VVHVTLTTETSPSDFVVMVYYNINNMHLFGFVQLRTYLELLQGVHPVVISVIRKISFPQTRDVVLKAALRQFFSLSHLGFDGQRDRQKWKR